MTASTLEIRYPRIVNNFIDLWRSDELENYMWQLITDTRGNRLGFPADILAEILFLRDLHFTMHPTPESILSTYPA
jgi:hypothetical protein